MGGYLSIDLQFSTAR